MRKPARLLALLMVALGGCIAGRSATVEEALPLGLSDSECGPPRCIVLAEFLGATSVSASPDGNWLVTDSRGLHRVTDGRVEDVAVPSLNVVSVDASAGLQLALAVSEGLIDILGAGGGLIRRLRISGTPESRLSSQDFVDRQASIDTGNQGRPDDLAWLKSGGLAVLESSSGAVVLFDEAGRTERVIREADGQSLNPVALAAFGDGVAVAGLQTVYVLDSFGTLGAQLEVPGPPASRILALTADGASMVVVVHQGTDVRAVYLHPDGDDSQEAPLPSVSVVDVATRHGLFYVLTPAQLLQISPR